jgi:hypothetical protein
MLCGTRQRTNLQSSNSNDIRADGDIVTTRDQVQIGLAEVLTNLREELAEAQLAGLGSPLSIEVTEAEVELQVSLAKEATPGAKVKFNVVAIGGLELGAEGRVSREATHRISLKLAIKDRQTGRNAEVANHVQRSWDS